MNDDFEPSTVAPVKEVSAWAEYPGELFVPQYNDGDVELGSTQSMTFGESRSMQEPPPCSGYPALKTVSSGIAPNKACPNAWSDVSCTCFSDLRTRNEWSFRVRKKSNSKVPEVPVSTSSRYAVETKSISRFCVPPSVKALRILGEEASAPVQLAYNFAPQWGSYPAHEALVEQLKDVTLETVELAKIDLSKVNVSAEFFPTTVTDIKLRSCNLENLGVGFLDQRRSSLVSLDLSDNYFTVFDTEGDEPSPLSKLNLSHNKFSVVPSSLTTFSSLLELDFSHNPVSNYAVSSKLFSVLEKLQTLKFDGILPASHDCPDGKWQTAHSVSFCVYPDSADTTENTALSTSNDDSTVQYIVTACAVVLVLALGAFVAKRCRKRRRNNDDDDDFHRGNMRSDTCDFDSDSQPRDLLDGTLSFNAMNFLGLTYLFSQNSSDPSHRGPTTLNDPIIRKHRLNINALRCEEELKSGGNGVVYRGFYRQRPVAIKRLRFDYVNDEFMVTQFLDEIALMSGLRHARIVEFIGCAWDCMENLSMITELMPRGDLQEVLQRTRGKPNALTWSTHKPKIALHIAEGLSYLHNLSTKVIHRDLKSKNVLLNAKFDAKLTDFGISRKTRLDESQMTGGIGTNFWIAPEVLAGRRYDERADIYSFGIVLSEIDTDDYPYWNDRSAQQPGWTEEERRKTQERAILRMVIAGTLRPQFSPECPKRILALAQQCLDDEPRNRPSAAQIVSTLRAFARSNRAY
ncbi:hypothetical protein Poli38472_014385 [Pythium oligandrum]|uniref:Protein kinase domain-containing protein n=1 Tax=Pythium oligandrum TaxID=41045 RepID=A0A8K1FFL6_PYTOL|nr:hypothetical protein Poli38472_014385 [Pythium oligandrum]|eukprot:TMW57782.1 hypothetical protein Poli38472_014385 [Pythium oligandrum]